MEWGSLLKKITDAAPAVGAFFGAPGIAVGAAISAIGKVFGLGADATADQVAAAVASDPQAALKLEMARLDYTNQEAERQHEERLKEGERQLETLRIELQDVKDARARDVATIQAGKVNYTMKILEWLITAGFFATLGIRMFVVIPPNQLENVGLLIGAMITAFITVVTFEFGTSVGSQRKTELLAKAEPIK